MSRWTGGQADGRASGWINGTVDRTDGWMGRWMAGG